MQKGKLSEYFERNYLKYQMDHGRMSLTKFSEILGFSKAYLSYLMDGKRNSMAYHTAVYVAKTLQDYEIMEILGYDNDGISEDPLSKLSPGLRKTVSSVMQDCKAKGIALDSPEAEKLLVSAIMEFSKQVNDKD